MKKIFKFMFAAAGVMALASCAEDNDLGFGDLSDVKLQKGDIVAVVENSYAVNEGNRAAMGEFETVDKNGIYFVWTEGDQFKLYGATTWRTDVFTLNSTNYNRTVGAFTSAKNVFEGKYGSLENDAAYAVYPTDICTIDEDRTTLTVELPTTIDYSVVDPAIYGKDGNQSEGIAYGVKRAMWGFVDGDDTSLTGRVVFRYLTAMLRVNTVSALPADAKYLVVVSDDKTDALSGTFTADIEEITNNFWEAKAGGKGFDDPNLEAAEIGTKNYVIVNLESAAEYDNHIYIPIPAQHYNGNVSVVLASAVEEKDGKLEYTPVSHVTFIENTQTEEKNVTDGVLRSYVPRDFTNKTNYYVVGTIIGEATTDCTLTKLSDINEYLKTVTVDRDMVINFTEQVASFIYDAGSSFTPGSVDSTLVIPSTWTGDYKVVLNFVGGTNGGSSLITSGDQLTDKRTPVEMEIHNNSSVNVVINVENVYVDASKGNSRYVNAIVAKNNGTVTLGKNVSVITAKEGAIVVDATETTAGEVNVLTEQVVEEAAATAATEKVLSVKVVGGKVKTVTHNGNGALEVTGGEVETLNNNGTGEVKVTNAYFKNLTNGENGGDVTVKNLVGGSGIAALLENKSDNALTIENDKDAAIDKIITAGGDITIDHLYSWEGLTINGTPENVNINDGMIRNLNYNGEGTLTYNTTGFSSIVESVKVNNVAYNPETHKDKIVFKSTWNGKTGAGFGSYQKKTVTANYDVYTAAELSLLLNSATVSGLTVNLYADIDLGKDNNWTGIEAYCSSTGEMAFNGNGHTISNVNIKTKAGKDYWLSGTGFINNTGKVGKFTAKDLTLTGVNTEAIKGFEKKIGGIGGFVGVQNNTGEYSGISVTGSYLGVQATASSKVDEGALHVAGLIGAIEDKNANSSSTTPETKIEGCNVNVEKIEGKWNLGGLVGNAKGNGDGSDKSIKLTMSKDTVVVSNGFAVTLTLAEGTTDDNHYGRVGMLLGAISGGGSNTTLAFGEGNTVTDCIKANKQTLMFNKCVRQIPNGVSGGTTTQQFIGKEINGIYYVGYSVDFEGKDNTVAGLETDMKIDGFNAFQNVTFNSPRR